MLERLIFSEFHIYQKQALLIYKHYLYGYFLVTMQKFSRLNNIHVHIFLEKVNYKSYTLNLFFSIYSTIFNATTKSTKT